MSISKKWIQLGITTVIVLFSAASVTKEVAAHHGFTGEYDASRPLYVQGTVRQVRWQSPHSTLIVEIPKNLEVPPEFRQLSASELGTDTQKQLTVSPELLGTQQRVEFPPVTSMVAPLQDRLQVGNSVQLVVLRNCEPPNQLRILLARVTDGTTVARAKTANQVNGCRS
ncbi:hypothetical protein C7Y66_22905 [Chroococcidiopsis sp. CCALA 051]|uniref:DUF6152 family protein n=1 Tax=Chroococcidiopsis sp. CCALA 051 TaxID=869949 RepID=UPI000D0DE83D|nr:DUF6152 family protein [Chroococcidiopsis sp. CCALA 051]MBE9018910.1 hypothetical protein [Chroococcidiopsidales cyanobacterium LEGE 13417]PSM46843.1 hypothetical protein C7Y66_22905 [Chroococcidiopsis sp. CCALA 051]